MSDDSFATSVPSPIATPIDAFLSAGASFTPSPVMATMFPDFLRASTILIFCFGLTLAYTWMSSAISRYSSAVSLDSSSPVIVLPVVRIPKSLAIAHAVFLWSPVIIFTLIPALIQSLTAFLASFFGGSISPSSPVNIRFSSVSPSSSILYAHPITLNAFSLISSIFLSIVSLISAPIISILPLLSMCLHLFRIISGAPFVKIIFSSPFRLCIVVIILRSLSRGISPTLV